MVRSEYTGVTCVGAAICGAIVVVAASSSFGALTLGCSMPAGIVVQAPGPPSTNLRSKQATAQSTTARPISHQTPATCPRVYIYPLGAPWSDLGSDYGAAGYESHTEDNLTVDAAFGKSWPKLPYYRQTLHFDTGVIFFYRLRHSSCRTTDPALADLFYIPFLPARKNYLHWGSVCKQLANKEGELLQLLPHLNEKTADRHFLVANRGGMSTFGCRGTLCYPTGLFQKVARVMPEKLFGQEELRQFPDLVSQHKLGTPPDPNDWPGTMAQMRSPGAYPRIYVVPLPSSLHWSQQFGSLTPPWASTDPRPILASYVGRFTHGDNAVRRKLKEVCAEAAQDVVCQHHDPASGPLLLEAHLLKARSVFCVEPIGDTLNRKSIADSIVAGCIPIFFGPAMGFLFPIFWEGWQSAAYVQVDRLAFLNGTLNLVQTLRSTPTWRIEEIQRNIRQYGGRFQASLEDMPDLEDVVSLTLRKLWLDAQAGV